MLVTLGRLFFTLDRPTIGPIVEPMSAIELAAFLSDNDAQIISNGRTIGYDVVLRGCVIGRADTLSLAIATLRAHVELARS